MMHHLGNLFGVVPGSFIRTGSAAQAQQMSMLQQSQYLQNSLSGSLAQALQSTQPMLLQQAMAHNIVPPTDGSFEWRRARYYAAECEKLIRRLLFWTGFVNIPVIGVFAECIAAKLANRIEAEVDEIERWIAMARKADEQLA